MPRPSVPRRAGPPTAPLAAAAASSARPAPGRRGHAAGLPPGFGVLWTTVAVDLLGFGIVVPLLPLYARHLGARPAAVGALLAVFSAAQLLGAPLLGRLSDRVGRRPVLVVSLVGTAAGSLLTGLAGSLWLLFAGRVVDGLSGGSVAVAQAAVADVAAPGQRARAFGLLGAGYGVGFVVGPAVGGLAALGGARLPFLVAAGIATVNAAVAVRRLPETRRPAAPGGHLGATADGGESGAGAWRGRWRRLMGPAVLTVVLVGSFSAFEATFPLLGHQRLALGLAGTGVVFALVGVVAAAVQAVAVGPLSARLGAMGTVRAGLVLEAVGLVLVAGVHSRPGLVVPLVLVTVGQGLCTPSLAALVAGRVAGAERGAALGTQQGLSALARVLGPAAGGVAYGAAGVGAPFVGGAMVLGVALAGSVLVRRGVVPGGRTRAPVAGAVVPGVEAAGGGDGAGERSTSPEVTVE